MRRLEGKVILIVGGTAGLGLSASQACLAAGAKLVIVGRDDEAFAAAMQSLGNDVIAVAGDAGDPKTAESAVQRAVEAFGRVDGAYHVAGGSGRRMGDGPLDQITDEGWRYTLDSNLTALFHTNRAVVRQLLAQKTGGAILNIGSVLGFSPSPANFSTHAYAAAKAAVVGLTKSCAAYYAKHNIRFNLLAPALVETPMSKRAATDEKIMRFVQKKQPLDGGRIGQPSDLDGAVVYLLSDESRFITGQVLSVDGGWCVSDASVSDASDSDASGGTP